MNKPGASIPTIRGNKQTIIDTINNHVVYKKVINLVKERKMYSSIRMIRNSEGTEGMRSHSFSLTICPTVRIFVRSTPYDLRNVNNYFLTSDHRDSLAIDPSGYGNVC